MSPLITEELIRLLLPGETVLDIGCGDASLLRELSGKHYSLYGIDPSFFFGTVPSMPDDVRLLPGAAEHLPFSDSGADTAIMQCVFSLCNPKETVSEVFRVLKPGGRLLLSDLYTDMEEIVLANSPFLGKIWLRRNLEAFFSPRFQQISFSDMTPALTEMIMDAIWSGREDSIVSCTDLPLLRSVKAKYGLWVWKKPL